MLNLGLDQTHTIVNFKKAGTGSYGKPSLLTRDIQVCFGHQFWRKWDNDSTGLNYT